MSGNQEVIHSEVLALHDHVSDHAVLQSPVAQRLGTVTITPPGREFADRTVQVFEPGPFEEMVLAKRAVNELLGRVAVPFPVVHHIAYSLAPWQTPVRDQGGRGTCFAFAGIAAVEAAYMRSYGVSLDLSEQYLFQIEKIGELYGDYTTRAESAHESNCSYWGAQGSSDILNHLTRAAMPTETLAPYLSQGALDGIRTADPTIGALDWGATQQQIDAFEFAPANIGLAARRNARYHATGWAQLPDVATATLQNAILANREVVLDITVQWKSVAGSDVLQYDSTSPGGGHCVLVVGFDQTAGWFEIKNSWGGTALTRVSYEFIEHCAFGGTYVLGVANPNDAPQTKAWWLGSWNMDHDGWRGTITLRRFTDFRNIDADAPTKLGDYRGQDGLWHDVNGYFIDGGQGVVFAIADSNLPSTPGTLQGQQFHLWAYSWDDEFAAGYTSWSGTNYGAVMCRAPIAGGGGGGFTAGRWLGAWALNHDGWRGQLIITSVIALPWPLSAMQVVDGQYIDQNGVAHAVHGILPDAGHPHIASLTIAFGGDPQPFTLHAYTWEASNLAGTTQWGGRTFGVYGHRL